MNFLSFDLGVVGPTNLVEVSLDAQARVLLLDASSYAAFQRGGSWRGQGGWAIHTPVCLRPPCHGHWFVVVDLNGAAGRIRVDVRVLGGLAA